MQTSLIILGAAVVVLIALWAWRHRRSEAVGEEISAALRMGENAATRKTPSLDEWEVIPLAPVVPLDGQTPVIAPVATEATTSRRAARGESAARGASPSPEELIIVLNVMAHPGRMFRGPSIIEITKRVGLEFGEMGIFHCPDPEHPGAPPLFSVANILEPGRFNLETMFSFSTLGLTFFMRLPGPEDGLTAFNRMHNAANLIAQALGGDLCDKQRLALTPQAIEEMRVAVFDFQRRQWTAQQQRNT